VKNDNCNCLISKFSSIKAKIDLQIHLPLAAIHASY